VNDDLPPDLQRLEAIEVYLMLALDRVRAKKAAVQRREEERLQGERARPPVPDWLVEFGLNRDAMPVAVHLGDCHIVKKSTRTKGVDSDTVRRALAGGVEACIHCRPDVELGFLE
jgi:hypothetical protein